MPANYGPDITIAQELIESFTEEGAPDSRLVKITKTGSFDPTITRQEHACKAVLLNHRAQFIDGTLIQRGDQRVYLSTEGLSVAPALKDKFIAPDNVEYDIVEPLGKIQPGTSVILWVLNVRR